MSLIEQRENEQSKVYIQIKYKNEINLGKENNLHHLYKATLFM